MYWASSLQYWLSVQCTIVSWVNRNAQDQHSSAYFYRLMWGFCLQWISHFVMNLESEERRESQNPTQSTYSIIHGRSDKGRKTISILSRPKMFWGLDGGQPYHDPTQCPSDKSSIFCVNDESLICLRDYNFRKLKEDTKFYGQLIF